MAVFSSIAFAVEIPDQLISDTLIERNQSRIFLENQGKEAIKPLFTYAIGFPKEHQHYKRMQSQVNLAVENIVRSHFYKGENEQLVAIRALMDEASINFLIDLFGSDSKMESHMAFRTLAMLKDPRTANIMKKKLEVEMNQSSIHMMNQYLYYSR